MKLNDVDFETYLKNYPSEDGYFGRFGGAYIPDELKPAFEEITNAYQTICHSSQFINELRRINILITGKDLIELGYKPSKSIAKALEAVLRVKLKFPDIDKTKELEIARENM